MIFNFRSKAVVSHILDFGDAITFSVGDAVSLEGDVGVGVANAHL